MFYIVENEFQRWTDTDVNNLIPTSLFETTTILFSLNYATLDLLKSILHFRKNFKIQNM